MKFDKSTAGTLTMLALLLGIAVAGHHGSALLLPKLDLTVNPDPDCKLQQTSCSTTLPEGGRMELSIAPRPIPILTPLSIEVTLTGIKANKVEVDFAGESMNMGFNRIELSANKDRHAGETSLPVCVSGGMNWIVTVLIETDRQRIAVPYRVAVGY
ncbi:MAG: hypothetical protein IPH39_13380 [Sulfuritalea sp.]|nr:hypothetical protein [Sulfuritalea sp.]MBK9349108.1 hypothetical protein [Sulfuritalea sp.]